MQRFIREFIRNPRAIGAVAPSSRALARVMVSDLDLSSSSVVVEYGPGTGAVTEEVLRRLRPETCFLAVEKNHRMAGLFRTRFPGVALFEDSVEHIDTILGGMGCREACHILSGLPWASFTRSQQDRLLDATLSVLKPGGRFTTFTYLSGVLLPAGQRFQRQLERRFSSVRKSRIVWNNLPPAFVYSCTK